MIIFTDGACVGNPGTGGWGVLVKNGSNNNEDIIFGGASEEETTNNRMELTAVIKALTYASYIKEKHVEIVSDSKYVVSTMNDNWKIKSNYDLWNELYNKIKMFDTVSFRWVKGHNGTRENEICDKIATKYAERGNEYALCYN